MKSKLVIWGRKGEEKSLLALSLRADESKVDVYVFPEEIATEDLYKQLVNEWKSGAETPFPEGVQHIEMELSASGELLPDDITTDNTDLISRAKTEWLFAVLSGKLSNTYQSELTVIKDKIDHAEKFDQSLWNELKEFWEKVQTQIREKNLFSEHIDLLRNNTNTLFDALKEKRKELDKQFQSTSSNIKEEFVSQLKEIEEKVSKGLSLQPLFEELKQLQSKFRNAMMTNSDKKNVWDKLDAAFKIVKEKRFGSKGGESQNPSSAKARLDNRYAGLLNAIAKMEKSIQFDQKDLDFQTSRINDPGGQLEVQIRQAKLVMIQDRISSKQAKLTDMVKTKVELESKRERIERQEASRREKEDARKLAEERIAAEIKAASELRTEQSDVLEKAAKQISESKTPPPPPKESFLGTIGSMVSESLEDAIDTVKAVSSVVGDRIEDAFEEAVDKIKSHALGSQDDHPADGSKPEVDKGETVLPSSDSSEHTSQGDSADRVENSSISAPDITPPADTDTDIDLDQSETLPTQNSDTEDDTDSEKEVTPEEVSVSTPMDKFTDEVAQEEIVDESQKEDLNDEENKS